MNTNFKVNLWPKIDIFVEKKPPILFIVFVVLLVCVCRAQKFPAGGKAGVCEI